MKENYKVYIVDDSIEMIQKMKNEIRKSSMFTIMGNAANSV